MYYDLVNFVLAITLRLTAIFLLQLCAIKTISNKFWMPTRPSM